MRITIYGIKACDTMKKAFTWLDQHGIEYDFHDYKKAGAPAERLPAWIAQQGWEQVINRRGTTWRKLPESARENMTAEAAASAAADNPSMIRRPLVEADGKVLLLGFDAAAWAQALGVDQ